MDGREIFTKGGVTCSLDGSLIDAADATAQVVKSVYNAIKDGGKGHEEIFRFLLMMALADPDSGVWDTVPDENIKKKEGCVINTALPGEIASDLEEEIKRRKSDETDRNPED